MAYEITLEDYNIENANFAILKKILADKPKIRQHELAKELGISVRTLIRWLQRYNLKTRSRKMTVEQAIIDLEELGYEIKPKTII